MLPELPERFARTGAPPPVNAVRNSGSNAIGFHQEFWHAIDQTHRLALKGEHPATVGRGTDPLRFRRRHRDYPTVSASRAMILDKSSPSARAAKDSAIRCLRTGSASAATSSTEGASRP